MSLNFRYRTGTLFGLPLDRLTEELDATLPRLYDSLNAQSGIAIQAPALNGGFSMQTGNAAVTGSLTGIRTGLATVTTVTASIATAVATNLTVTAQPTPSVDGSIDVYVWQPTSSSSTVPIACTTPVLIHWVATGTSTLS